MPPPKLTAEQRVEAARRYAAGESSVKLGAAFNCNYMAIIGAVRKAGGMVRTFSEAHRRFPVNTADFESYSPAAAYWTGFLFADGSVTDRGCIRLALAEKDGEHVVAFRNFVCPLAKVGCRQHRGFKHCWLREVSIGCVRLADFLQRAGLKKHNHSRAVPMLAASPHFWRGVIDGDGCVSCPGMPRIELVGGEVLVGQFLAWAKSLSPACKSTVLKHKSIWRTVVNGVSASLALKAMYETDGPALPRKKMRAIDAIGRVTPKAMSRARSAHARLSRTCVTPGCGGAWRERGRCVACLAELVAQERAGYRPAAYV